MRLYNYKNKKAKTVFELFKKSTMFWDVNLDNLSYKDDHYFIISRVLDRNMMETKYLEALESIYKLKNIKQIALNSTEIRGNRLIEFLAKRYDFNPKDFKNYIEGA